MRGQGQGQAAEGSRDRKSIRWEVRSSIGFVNTDFAAAGDVAGAGDRIDVVGEEEGVDTGVGVGAHVQVNVEE